MNWKVLSFENCLEKVKSPKKLNKKKYLNKGKFPVVAQENTIINGYTNDESLVFKIKNPVIIFGDHTRKLKYIDFDFVIGADGAKIIKPKSDINVKFFYYYLTHMLPKSIGYARHYKLLKKIKFNIPSLSEQQRIVAKLDTAFAEIDKTTQLTEKKIVEIEQFSAQAITSVFFDKKNKSFKKFKEIVSIKGGKRLPKGKKLTTENTGFPYIRVSDFNDDGTINLKSVKFIEADVQKQLERYVISSKDVYLSIAGTIGKTGIIPKILENANLTENAVKLVPHECLDKEFLYFFTQTKNFKEQAIKQTRIAAQPKLAIERLGNVEIPLFNLKKQIEIVSKARNILNQTKLVKVNCSKKLEYLAKLNLAILKQELKVDKAA